MLKEMTEPGATARKFVFDAPESRRSRFAKFLVKHVFRFARRYEKLSMTGPAFDRTKMIHSVPKAGGGVTVTPARVGNSDYYVLRCGPSQTARVVYYIHGGGFIEGPAIGHCYFCREMCARTATDVVMLDYPKAPEHSQQEMLASVHAMYRELAERYGARNVIVMGDSAGGTLTLALAHLLRQKNEELPARLVMLSPTLDVRYDHPGMRDVEPHDPLLSVALAHRFREAYLSKGGNPLDPLVSPIFGDLKGLPPMVVFMGTHEVLLPYGREFFEKTKAAGAQLDYYEFPNMMHVWMLFLFAEARAARERIYEIVRSVGSA